MDGLVLEYRDPLFGIIIFVALIFIVALTNYGMVTLRKRKEGRDAGRFIEQFQIHSNEDELQLLLENRDMPNKSLILLAKAYLKSGEYEHSIEIYQALLARAPASKERKELLLLLGYAYFMAGFMQRSKQTLLELLHFAPRTPDALKFLMIIYERLLDFNKANEVLEPLQELGINTVIDARYLSLLSNIKDTEKSSEEKFKILTDDYRANGQFVYMIFEYLFAYEPFKAWPILQSEDASKIVDLLWHMDRDSIDFDHVKKDSFLTRLYSAKGYINGTTQAREFELDLLIQLNKLGHNSATLQFEYLCNECKHVFPIPFNRCPNCLALNSSRCDLLLTPVNHEAGYSFQ